MFVLRLFVFLIELVCAQVARFVFADFCWVGIGFDFGL